MLKLMLTSLMLFNSHFQCSQPTAQQTLPAQIFKTQKDGPKAKIQVALLLDTSNSMDGAPTAAMNIAAGLSNLPKNYCPGQRIKAT